MDRPYETYFLEPGNRRFLSLMNNKSMAEIYKFMSCKDNVEKMVEASIHGRPALEAVIEEIERRFPFSEEFNLQVENRHRQLLGSLCRFILQIEGYYPDKALKLKKGNYIGTATVYKSVN